MTYTINTTGAGGTITNVGAGGTGGSNGTVTLTGTVTGTSGAILGATGSTYNWNGVGSSTWNTTYSVGAGVGINGSYTVASPVISLDVDEGKPMLKTAKNQINLDELADMMKLMQSLLVAVAADEEFAKRNPALADAAHDMLIKKLKE